MTSARIVIAPDSFKGSASALDAAEALRRGWLAERPGDEVVLLPMADGGEGSVDAFAAAVPGAERRPLAVTGPDGRTLQAEWLLLPDGTGVVELANASGITLLDPLQPHDAHSLGFGQLIADALDAGVHRLVLAIGGSSSTDGGFPALAALGARFLDAHGEPVPLGNRGLAVLASVELEGLRPPPIDGVTVLSDVTSPLLGPEGAAAVFGPQKGATPEDVAVLDANLARLAALLRADADAPGTGAAGGAGYGLLAWGARLTPGSGAVGEALGAADAVRGARAVITGEGRFDAQSAVGKVPSYIRSLADDAGAATLLVAGAIEAPTEGFGDAMSLTELAGSGDSARADALRWLERAGRELAVRFAG